MKTIKLMTKGLLGASVISLFAAGTAFAGGTQAGTSVKNTFTLEYKVGTVTQPTISTCQTGDVGCTTETSTNFTVDRVVDLTVGSNGNTTVAPGEQDAKLLFTVTNDSNDTMAYALSLVNETGDTFDTTGLNITYYVDNNDANVCDVTDLAGTATAYTPGSGDETVDLPADRVLCVVVDGDIPLSYGAGPTAVVDADTSEISLVADTLYASTHTAVIGTDVPGSEVLPDAGGVNSLEGVAENFLADVTGTAGSGDGDNDGAHSATGTYIVASANLAATKSVEIFKQDATVAECKAFPGTPGAGEQYSVPGACVEYVIEVVNGGATAAATDIDISDVLPDDLEFVSAQVSADLTGGTLSVPGGVNPVATTAVDCNAGACTVSLTNATLAATNTGTLTIRALIK